MNNKKFTAKRIAFIAIMSALLIAGKFALSFIPNVEVVTTLIICFSFVFKFDAIIATIVFCTANILIYPSPIDVILDYYIYWDLLALIVVVLSELGEKRDWIYLTLGVVMTVFFGFLTSFIFCLCYSVPFWPYYVQGILFYAIQIISTCVFMFIGFNPINKILFKIKGKL